MSRSRSPANVEAGGRRQSRGGHFPLSPPVRRLALALGIAAASVLAAAVAPTATSEACADADGDGLDACLEAAQGTLDSNPDTDGDALSDFTESTSNPDRVALFCGASCAYPSPLRKDVYVEMDHMGASHLPHDDDLDRIVAAYARSPFAGNPDGSEGLSLHLDAGPARAARFDLGGGSEIPHRDYFAASGCMDWSVFDAEKEAHLATARRGVYHYMVWAHSLGPTCAGTSGISRNAPASDFLVSLGGWLAHGLPEMQVGTFLHELGHNMGLRHGGADNVNWKPNYLSVMNYHFQDGIPRVGGGLDFDYARFDLPTLAESALDESAGLGPEPSEHRTRWFCNRIVRTELREADLGGPVDWSCDGVIEPVPITMDVTGTPNYLLPGTAGVNPPVYPCAVVVRTSCQTLDVERDWGRLVYDGGLVGHADATLPLDTGPVDELTREMAEALQSLQ